jgi:hypothetical protein
MRYYLFLLLATFFCGCSDDDQLSRIYTGTAQALKNGEVWNAYVFFGINSSNKRLYANFEVLDREGHPKEGISINQIKRSYDLQVIYPSDIMDQPDSLYAFYSTLVTGGGDVLGHFYILDTASFYQDGVMGNNFQITNYNSKKSEIEGTFDISFLIFRESNEDPNPPQKIHFTEGKFKVKVSQEWFD